MSIELKTARQEFLAILQSKEVQPRVDWARFQAAWEVFSGDYGIVKHPYTPVRSPFDDPNGLDEHRHRQYNLTQIKGMSEETFLNEFRRCNTIFVSCMDKDAVKPEYMRLKQEPHTSSERKIFLISVAGGIVQIDEHRKHAMDTILLYLSERDHHIKEVIVTGHDHCCGYVKHERGGESLAEGLGVVDGCEEEGEAMKQLISHSAINTEALHTWHRKVTIGLVKIDRKGRSHLDTRFGYVEPQPIEAFPRQKPNKDL